MDFHYNIDEINTELNDVDEVYVRINDETLKKLFDEADEVPANDEGYEDNSYVSGEIQFVFEKGTDNLEEILVFPVYSTDGEEELVNGDFINAPVSVYDYAELITDVRKCLKQAS